MGGLLTGDGERLLMGSSRAVGNIPSVPRFPRFRPQVSQVSRFLFFCEWLDLPGTVVSNRSRRFVLQRDSQAHKAMQPSGLRVARL